MINLLEELGQQEVVDGELSAETDNVLVDLGGFRVVNHENHVIVNRSLLLSFNQGLLNLIKSD